MKKAHLDMRLKTAMNYVTQGGVAADIGTDHAYLPCRLIQENISRFCIASDIKPEPLNSAKRTVDSFCLQDKIKLILCDGLSKFDNDDIEKITDIIIAGMGGEMIVSIIDNADWLKSDKYNLILQPMTKSDILRKYLCENGFEIIDETACVAKNKHYTVMNVKYCGGVISYDELFLQVGRLNDKFDDASLQYKQMILNKLTKTAKGLILGSESQKGYEILEICEQIRLK